MSFNLIDFYYTFLNSTMAKCGEKYVNQFIFTLHDFKFIKRSYFQFWILQYISPMHMYISARRGWPSGLER